VTAVAGLLVPSALVEETADPRIRTYKVGQIGRAAAVFAVPEIVVYDFGEAADGRWIQHVLEYQACAPYLRKRLFPLSPDLAHAGVLPPLNLPTHLVTTDPVEGEVRMGVPLGAEVDVGLARPARAREPIPARAGQVPVEVVRVARGGHVEVAPYTGSQFTGYAVRRATSLHAAIRDFRHVVGTSRAGRSLAETKVPFGAALAFGTPSTGLQEILGTQAGHIPYVNTVPQQGTKSVRTEEAVWATLGAVANIVR